MRIVNLDQNSEDWLLWRQAGLGTSDAPILLGTSPWKSPEELWREKRTALLARRRGRVSRGWDDETPAMKRGKALEPEACKLFEMLTGLHLPPVCGVHDDHDWLRASHLALFIYPSFRAVPMVGENEVAPVIWPSACQRRGDVRN